MPELSGDEFLAQARTISSAVPILITGYADLQALIRAVNQGKIYAYIPKPWDPLQLRATVDSAARYYNLVRALHQEKKLLQTLMDNVPDAIWFKDEQLKFSRINRAQASLLGIQDPAQALGRSLLDFLPGEEIAAMHREEEELLRGGRPVLDRVEMVRTASGEVRWVSSTKVPIRDPEGKMAGLIGVSRDITEREMLARQAQLMYRVTQAVGEARDFEEALQMTLQKILEATAWCYGEAWLPASGRQVLRRRAVCHDPDPALDKFCETSGALEFGPGEGLVGRVWLNRKPEWLHDLSTELSSGFYRWESAREAGLGSGLALPVTTGDQILMVLLFAMSERRDEDERMVHILSAVGASCGAVLQRKRAEEERDRFFTLSLDLLCVAGFDGYFQQLNPSWTRTLGYTLEELKAKPLFEFIHNRDREAMAAKMLDLQEGLQALTFENRYRSKSGEYRWLSWTASASPKEERVYAVARDVTERKQREAELRESNRLLEAMIQASPLAIVVLDREGRVKIWNEAAENLFDWSRQEVTGQPYPLIPRNKIDEFLSLRKKLRAGQAVAGLETMCLRKDGSCIEVRISAAPLWDGPCQFAGEMILISDITEERQLERQLLHAQKMEAIGRLAGGIAHDFNNLLTGINGYVQLALSQLDTSSQAAQDLVQVRQLSGRAVGLIRQLLTFSRRQAAEPGIVDVNSLIENIQRMLVRLIGEQIRLHFHPGPGPLKIRIDPGQFEQVLMNLALNAADAMPEGGDLTLQTSAWEVEEGQVPGLEAGSYVTLTVSDSGVGMDAATQQRIFEPFFTTKGPEKGTGLGLAIVYGILRQNGGHVRVRSQVGQGTSFEVFLPRAQEKPVAAEPRPEPETMPRGQETILLVEDEPSVREFLERVLKALEYTVVSAGSLAEARQVFQEREGKIDLLLSDFMLPGGRGHELYRELARLRPELKVLFMSGYSEEDLASLKQLEEVPFLRKPFGPGVLARKVREVLDQQPPHSTESQA